jgi:hypothetical protein
MLVFIKNVNESNSGNDWYKGSTNGRATYDNVERQSRM